MKMNITFANLLCILLISELTSALSWNGKIENGITRKFRKLLPPKTSVLISRLKKSRHKNLSSYYQNYCVGVIIGAYTVLTAGICTMPNGQFYQYDHAYDSDEMSKKPKFIVKGVDGKYRKIIHMHPYNKYAYSKNETMGYNLGVVIVNEKLNIDRILLPRTTDTRVCELKHLLFDGFTSKEENLTIAAIIMTLVVPLKQCVPPSEVEQKREKDNPFCLVPIMKNQNILLTEDIGTPLLETEEVVGILSGRSTTGSRSFLCTRLNTQWARDFIDQELEATEGYINQYNEIVSHKLTGPKRRKTRETTE